MLNKASEYRVPKHAYVCRQKDSKKKLLIPGINFQKRFILHGMTKEGLALVGVEGSQKEESTSFSALGGLNVTDN